MGGEHRDAEDGALAGGEGLIMDVDDGPEQGHAGQEAEDGVEGMVGHARIGPQLGAEAACGGGCLTSTRIAADDI